MSFLRSVEAARARLRENATPCDNRDFATPATENVAMSQMSQGGAHAEGDQTVAMSQASQGAVSCKSENASCDAADRDYEVAERAAIAEFGGGLPRQWADCLTRLSFAPRPAGLGERAWRERLERLWEFADRHASALHKAGWSFDDVFAIGGPWPRLDRRGAAWFCPTGLDIEISADCIRWRTPSGATLSVTRHSKDFTGDDGHDG